MTCSATFPCSPSELGLAAMKMGALKRIARLYWYTVEFGLAREAGETRIYGAGILSSFGESRFALESPEPHRLAFDLRRVLTTDYRTDSFQKSYFVMPSLEDVLRVIEREDVLALCRELEGVPDVDPATVAEHDRLAA
jgi:phenylalanine-4-hydroxylase